jgi:hypothetical protein
VAEIRFRTPRSPRRALAVVAFTVALVLAARALGGFFAPQPTDPGALIGFAAHGITPHFASQFFWNLVGLGLLLPLGIAGLRRLAPEPRWVLGAIAAGGLLVTNLFAYPHSWDIVKFSTASAVILGLASSALFWKWIVDRPTVTHRTLGLSLFALTILPGIAFLSVFALRMPGVPRQFIRSAAPIAADDAQAIDWLRGRMGPRDIAYRNLGASAAYAQWGGIAQPYVDSATPGFGFPAAMIERRNALVANLPAAADAYLAEGIRWFVLDGTDTTLREHVREWQRQGRCESVARCGGLEIFALH